MKRVKKTTEPQASSGPANGNETLRDIRNRLSLRKPQADSLEILAKIAEVGVLKKNADTAVQLKAVKAIAPNVTAFDRDFCSLCFALATGVGKTRLMGAFISYLHEARKMRNFVVIAPNLTIYEKLIADFTPGTPKYVFRGIKAFAANPPVIITGETYQSGKGVQTSDLLGETVVINIFNIAKLTAKDKGHLAADDAKAKVARIRRLVETIGQSYFDYLAGRDDLVVLMDESHRYRAEAGMAAINELKPVLGIELTATPRVIRGTREIPFNNIAYEYTLAEAMRDGFVKEPAIATRMGFNITDYVKDSDELERLKLNDGALIHENTKAALANWAQNHNRDVVKPFMLVVAGDKAHADALEEYMASDAFRKGAYEGKIVKVYSGMSAEMDAKMVGQLLEIEKPGNPVEIVIHVNMLSEGWDVTNLYTIVPLRAANSVNLVEQSIGRGLRLPYGERTGDEAVDTLTVVSHDNYAAVISKARERKGFLFKSYVIGGNVPAAGKKVEPITPANKALAEAAKSGKRKGVYLPDCAGIGEKELTKETGEALEAVNRVVEERMDALKGCDLADKATFDAVVKAAVKEVREQTGETIQKKVVEKACMVVEQTTIAIPRVEAVPKGVVVQGFKPFRLDTAPLKSLNPVDSRLRVTTIREQKHLKSIVREAGSGDRAENYLATLIGKLREAEEIDYEGNAKLVVSLAKEAVDFISRHFEGEVAANVLMNNAAKVASVIRSQLEAHAVYKDAEYEFKVTPGCVKLGLSSALMLETEPVRDFRTPIKAGEKSRIKSMVFAGFRKCLYEKQKFDSNPERMFAQMIEDEKSVLKWFRPDLSRFSIRRNNGENYFPDFVVETRKMKYVCEVKADSNANDSDVIDKWNAAVAWCETVSAAERAAGRKEWRYVFIKESQIDEAMTFRVAIAKFVETARRK